MDVSHKLQEMITEFDVGMLITNDGKNAAGRPMAIAEHDEITGELVFSTSLQTEKVEEIDEQPNVAVVLQSKTRYVSLTGIATISNDRQKIKELFNKSWELWYPDGPEQPDIRLIKFAPVKGEYWDMSGTEGLRFVWEAGKALAKGERLATHEKMQHAETTV